MPNLLKTGFSAMLFVLFAQNIMLGQEETFPLQIDNQSVTSVIVKRLNDNDKWVYLDTITAGTVKRGVQIKESSLLRFFKKVGQTEVKIGSAVARIDERIQLNKPGFKLTVPRIACLEESDAGEEVELQVDINLNLNYGQNSDHELKESGTIRTDVQEKMSVHNVWEHTFNVPSEYLDEANLNISLTNAKECDDTSPDDPLTVTNNPDSKYNDIIKGLGKKKSFEGSYDIKGDGNSLVLFFKIEKIEAIESLEN